MHQSNGPQFARCLLAVLAFASSTLARADEVTLAPVIDLSPRHHAGASDPLEEPKSLVVAARALPLPAEAALAAARPAPARDLATRYEQSKPLPTIRSAAPFDPTSESVATQPNRTIPPRTAEKLAPLIRVYEPILQPVQPQAKDSIVARPIAPAQGSPLPEPMHRSVFLATRADRLQRTTAQRTRLIPRRDATASRVLAALESLPRRKPAAPAADHTAEQSDADDSSLAIRAPRLSAFVQIAETDPVSGNSESSSIVELATNPIVPESPTAVLTPQQLLASNQKPVLKLVDESLPQRLAPTNPVVPVPLQATIARPVIQLADGEPLLAVLQPSGPAGSQSAGSQPAAELPIPAETTPLTEEQQTEAELIESFELGVKPIHALSVRTAPEAGEMPQNYAATRFAREGEVAHRMGFSRATVETELNWESPASCHRPLYFEEINLERHGYKVPLVQPALSAAHFFGRVPLLPYMAMSEGHRKCQYTLGHYRPGDYAPYSLYVPRLRLDAATAEAAVLSGVFFIFP